MNIKNRSNWQLALLAIIVLGVSSCHRGYGCPSNFSISDTFGTFIETILSIF